MTTINTSSKSTASINNRELTITRNFQAPREIVYKAWTDPKHLPRWWGPEGFTSTTQEMDIRAGGVWSFIMHGPEGTDYVNKITFLEVAAPERLEYAHGDGEEDELFRVTVTFEEADLHTRLTMRMLFKSVEELEKSVQEFGAIEGADSTLARLEIQLPNIMLSKIRNQELTLERIFNAPRELVFKAFSEAEHLKHWWGPRGWTLTVCTVDFRPGGAWHYCMKCMDPNQGDFYGVEAWGKAVYREIIDGEKIVYTDYFSDADGNESQELPASEITMIFEEYEGKTRLISHSKFASADALKTVIDMGMEQGITETWDRLAEHLQSIQ